MPKQISESVSVPWERFGQRFDRVAAELFPSYSRSRIQTWIRAGDLTLNGKAVKPNIKLCGGEVLVLRAQEHDQGDWVAEPIPLEVVYKDSSIIVINKEAGLVVHPASGNWTGTLLNGLIHQFPELLAVPRAGIVHRLDKDTSGLMVVARTMEAQTQLVSQLHERSVKRRYHAIVECFKDVDTEGTIDEPIGRHPAQRTKMAVVKNGKVAKTHYKIVEDFGRYKLVELRLQTGRTHQIRVHMSHIGCPLLGDGVYGRSASMHERQSNSHLKPIFDFPRQALHAVELGLIHPQTKDYCHWQSDVPEDFLRLLEFIEKEFA